MSPLKSMLFLGFSACMLAACEQGVRSSVRAAGSSTVMPFAEVVAENFVRSNPQFRSPVIEGIGSGAGIKLFCSGLGFHKPDIANASRRMKPKEFADCKANGVREIVELQVGLDGLAFASAKGGIRMNLSPKIVYEALAARPYGKEQTARNWADVDPSLPDEPIHVYGPPSTSGTRDALKELVLEAGCDSDPAMQALKQSDKDTHEQICTQVRADGAYVDQSEQDNLIVQKIANSPRSVGIFGYSYLEENSGKIEGLPMNGVAPTYDNIASFTYPGARPLYVYVKKAHIGVIPGLDQFLIEWTKNWKRGGPLARIGLVASSEEVMAQYEKVARDLTTISLADLEG